MTSILESHTYSIKSMVFSSNSLLLATNSRDRTVKVWDVMTATTACSFSSSEYCSQVTLSPTGKMLATADHDNTIRLWDTKSG
jgi:WD40 repeat protein